MGSSRHLIQRGRHYSYVCRVPRDLQHLFPRPTLWKSLKTDCPTDARVLASAEEYRTQQLFMQLRSGMLSKELETRLIALYLKQGVQALESRATGQGFDTDHIDAVLEINKEFEGVSQADVPELRAKHIDIETAFLRRQLAAKEPLGHKSMSTQLARKLTKTRGIKMNSTDIDVLALKLMNADKRLLEAESAMLRGEWTPMESIREQVNRDLAAPYFNLETVLKRYQEHYIASKPNVSPGAKDDMIVECRVLLEVYGNISITEFNSMESVAKLKHTLQKYPKNKQQRYGDKSIHTIIRSESGYEVISPKTANNYLQRAVAVVDYALKAEMVTTANKFKGERFNTQTAEEEERSAYDSADITRLIDALCTKPLWRYNPPKPERFWVVLIALFHGLRLGNIIKLTKEDICQTDKGTWVFRLRTGKTKATVRHVAICDALLLLGFLDWVEGLERNRLFQDSADSFSKWYNRTDKKADGSIYTGFEGSYITTDPKKCLYSLRHFFAENIFDVTEDYKITSDMMGHSTAGSVTARYTKRAKAETLKEITDKMRLGDIDLDRLEERAKELFFSA